MIFCPFTPVIADLQAGNQYIKSTYLMAIKLVTIIHEI